MANLVPDRSEDPEVRQLAFDIAETQTNQAGRMEGWLALWGAAADRRGGDGLDGRGRARPRHARTAA